MSEIPDYTAPCMVLSRARLLTVPVTDGLPSYNNLEGTHDKQVVGKQLNGASLGSPFNYCMVSTFLRIPAPEVLPQIISLFQNVIT